MTDHRHVPAAAGLALVLGAAALGGCAASAPDAWSTASPSTTSSTASTKATTTPTAQPRSSFPPGVPTAAQDQSTEGAKAFSLHVVRQINIAWTTPGPKALEPLCDMKASKACAGFVSTAKDLMAKSRRYDGPPIVAAKVFSLTPVQPRTEVLLTAVQERRSVVDRHGRVVLTDPREPMRCVMFLSWTAQGWKLVDFKQAGPA